MSDFSRISDEVVGFVHMKFGGKGALKTPESTREFLEQIEPLLVTPHIRYIIGESTPEESSQGYVGGAVRRLMEVEDGLTEALDDLNPRSGGFTRHQSKQVTSTGDLHVNQSVTGSVNDAVFMIGSVGGSIDVRGDRR